MLAIASEGGLRRMPVCTEAFHGAERNRNDEGTGQFGASSRADAALPLTPHIAQPTRPGGLCVCREAAARLGRPEALAGWLQRF